MAKHQKTKPFLIPIIILAVLLLVLSAGAGIWAIYPYLTADTSGSEPSSSEPSSSAPSLPSEPSSDPSSETEPVEISLSITAPEKQKITVNKPTYTIKGSGDPEHPVIINGEELPLDETGLFTHQIELTAGNNTVEITHKDKTESFTINYQRTVIKSLSPATTLTVESNSDLVVTCTALKGSKVTATWNGQTITLYKVQGDEDASDGDYEEYAGGFTTPINQGKLKSYGKVTFKAVSEFGTTTKTSAAVKVKTFDPDKFDGGNGYPAGSEYLNVGKTHIIEVVHLEAETFDAKDATDLSRPTNNYLPKGTVDYCSPYTKSFTISGDTVKMYTARYGKQLYGVSPRGTVNTKVYEGTLPETNQVSLSSTKTVGHHTVMTFDVNWKAPFRFEMEPQQYEKPSAQNYIITEPTFTYIDITFCYADTLTGLPNLANHPVFSSAEIINGEYDRVLRLHLKEKGVFYGWSAEYNEAGQLEFWFLNPTELKSADNEYGVSLEGITVLVDAGHGGYDNGAYGFISGVHEQHMNIFLAKEVEKQLKALGATVIMTRTDDSYVTVNDRIAAVKTKKPDYVVSIHRNGSDNSKASGFSSYYFNPYSFEAAKIMLDAADTESGFAKTKWTFNRWHLFFLCRVTECPSVLTENGFVSNKEDYALMQTEEQNQKNAKAIVDGIVNYFKQQ
jgi:N-acetylmuramoyl-L-alanine amidase